MIMNFVFHKEFTSITTLGMGTIQSMTLTMQIQKGSKSDGDFRNMTSISLSLS